jgi:hypothetical protein
MNNTISLTPAALNWLGSAFEKKTMVSPLSTAPQEDFTQAGLDSLVKQGVVTAEKTLTTDAYALLDILAGAKKFASVQLSGGSGKVNRVTYWNGGKSVSFDNNGGTFILTPGNNVEGLGTVFQEICGSNRLISSKFSTTFDHRSALVFAGLFDLSRRAAIRLYADGADVPEGFSAAEVGQFVSSTNNARWLTSHIKTLNVKGLSISTEQAAASLKGLAEAAVIGAARSGLYTLAYDSAQLAANFLFIENVIHFRSGSENGDGKLASAECMFLQAGIHDVIMVDLAADKIELSAVSSFAMIEDIKTMLTVPPSF